MCSLVPRWLHLCSGTSITEATQAGDTKLLAAVDAKTAMLWFYAYTKYNNKHPVDRLGAFEGTIIHGFSLIGSVFRESSRGVSFDPT